MVEKVSFKPQGICSQMINVEIENDKVLSVEFIGGCRGNQTGISNLVRGMNVGEVIERLEGISCGFKPTSCPDQLTIALKQARCQAERNK